MCVCMCARNPASHVGSVYARLARVCVCVCHGGRHGIVISSPSEAGLQQALNATAALFGNMDALSKLSG